MCFCRDVDDLQQVLMINVVGTFAVTKAFLPMLKHGRKKTIVNISSDAASLTLMNSYLHDPDAIDGGKGLSYKASKCAVNMRKPRVLLQTITTCTSAVRMMRLNHYFAATGFGNFCTSLCPCNSCKLAALHARAVM